jgi:hypothetical protein
MPEGHSREKCMNLCLEECKLIELIRQMEWGSFYVQVKRGKPAMATEIRKDVKLTEEKS